MKKNIWLGLVLLLIMGTGCGPGAQFSRARKLEEKGRYYRAWELYQEFVARHPKHKMAAEALFRAGWVAQKGLADCFVAKMFYEKVLVQYPQSEPWAKAAALQPMNCPDYFPLIPGSRWTEGDSDSKGHFSKTDIECKALGFMPDALPSQAGRLEKTYYAGKKKFRDANFIYKKEKGELLEFMSKDDSRAKVLLKWPLDPGTQWRTRMGGRYFRYEVVGDNEIVKVVAGRFESCLKLKSTVEGGIGARYEYFAPGVGRVLTTMSTKSGEKRHIELISYNVAELPKFKREDLK